MYFTTQITLAKTPPGLYDSQMSKTAKRIYFILFDDVELLDIAGPAEVFAQANSLLSKKAYDLRFVCSNSNKPVTTTTGLPICGQALPRMLGKVDTVFVPGGSMPALEKAIQDQKLMTWLRNALPRSQRIASVCTGAFILGALGELDQHQVTTHWAGINVLQDMFPSANVQNDTLYINDGDLWTSAGVLSGVDMALAIIAKDHSRTLALEIARILVVYLMRDGGQSQFSAPMDLQAKAAQSELLNLSAWLMSNLDKTISVTEMAEHMATSVRSLHRRCLDVFGISPAKLFVELRLEHARELLGDIKLPVKSIGFACGYASSEAFSKAFRQRYGVSPQHYRQRF